ncbi:uncharacterized protein [Diadema setosum]|uniref:uncharacterized protein n=1 Tax=Diadema setosum TaxID=31175 RepID=UPI003B3ACA87
MGVDLPPYAIDRSHRIRRMNPPPEGAAQKPRPIIVKFTSYKYRQLLFSNKRKLKEARGQNKGISLHEDFTDARRALLWEAFQHMKTPNSKIQHAWTMNGRVYVVLNSADGHSTKKVIHSRRDLDMF